MKYKLGSNELGGKLRRSQSDEIERWLDQLAESFQVLPMDTPCFRESGRLMDHKPDQLLEDGMIAATARVHHLIVVTRNERDFKQLGVRILNPFKTSYIRREKRTVMTV